MLHLLLEGELLGNWTSIQGAGARLPLEVIEVLLYKPATAFAARFLREIPLPVSTPILD